MKFKSIRLFRYPPLRTNDSRIIIIISYVLDGRIDNKSFDLNLTQQFSTHDFRMWSQILPDKTHENLRSKNSFVWLWSCSYWKCELKAKLIQVMRNYIHLENIKNQKSFELNEQIWLLDICWDDKSGWNKSFQFNGFWFCEISFNRRIKEKLLFSGVRKWHIENNCNQYSSN